MFTNNFKRFRIFLNLYSSELSKQLSQIIIMFLFIYFKNNRNQSSVRLVDLIIIKFEEKGAISMNTPKLFAYYLMKGQ